MLRTQGANEAKEVFAVRKKLRTIVLGLPARWIERGERLRVAAGCGHPVDRLGLGRIEDRSVLPCTAARCARHGGQCYRNAACCLDLLQVGERLKGDPAA